MADLVNPFLSFKNPADKKNHNPYRFNPFTVLSLAKEDIIDEIINEKIEELKFYLDPDNTQNYDEEGKQKLNNAFNAQRFLQHPLQRLAFELLLPDTSESTKQENFK